MALRDTFRAGFGRSEDRQHALVFVLQAIRRVFLRISSVEGLVSREEGGRAMVKR